MKRILYVITVLAFLACNTKNPEVAQADKLNSASNLQPMQANAVAQSDLIFNPKHGAPGHDCSIAVGAPLKSATKPVAPTPPPSATQVVAPQAMPVNAPQATANVATKGKKLNPAHGEQNHRCDIAVGAPLDSKPVQTNVAVAQPQVVQQAPATTATTQVPTVNEKGQKLNPPHGQPNHRCDLAVGAPLT